ncbi:MAG TPA: NADP-dependent oxidoreductase [Steroidobacteraceae bacterium]|jgi:NADPH:quinone reductase-like Zn-dependent oxidoreductase|nr:NADP-dependent oxidoreductase [Steroidobacteraceae bacterium]
MTTMKAVRIRSFGGPEVLELADIAKPEPKDDELLIKVRAASVNPVDYKIRSGAYPVVKQDQLPRVLGRDVAGEVERCGRAVRNFKEGDTVYAMLDGAPGGYAEYVTVKADLVAPKPGQLDYRAAAAVPLAGLTAWQGLFDHGHLQAGQRVLIHGGAGGVGHLAVQFAKARGATVATTVASEDVEFVKHLGADQVIDYTHERFEEKVQDIDLVLDLIAGETQDRSWAVLKDGGTMISSLAQPSEAKAREHHARAEHFVAHPDRAELIEIGRLIDDGQVHPHVSAVFELKEAAEAQVQLERHHAQGKVVLQVG